MNEKDGNDLRKTIENTFTYHAPNPGQATRYETIREHAKRLALCIHTNCPHTAEMVLAIRKLQEAVMWANASIAINESDQ